MMQAIILLEQVSKRFNLQGGSKSFTALENVSLEVRAGEFLSLLGPSGCGKTTLLKMMSGLVSLEEGRIRLRGQAIAGVPAGISFVFQEIGLLPWRSVAQNVALGLQGRTAAEKEALVAKYLGLTGLKDFARYFPYQLSGGMQQRVGLARALAVEPDVLFMDEPFGALDALTRARLQQELAAIVERTGTTVVFVTHDVDEAIFLSDRVAVFASRPGRLQAVVDVPLSRPRQRTVLRGNADVAKLRDELLSQIETPLLEMA